MRARSFIIGLTISIISILLICLGLWKATAFNSPLNLHNEAIEIPQAAKFFPKDNYFTIHLKLDLNNLPKYIEAIVPEKKRKVAKQESIKLRDGIFALIGLDYEKDLVNQFDSRISFSILNKLESDYSNRWLLVLNVNSEEENNTLLKDYWERKQLIGTELIEELNEDIKIKYGKRKNLNEYKETIATAYTPKNEFLIASDLETLKESLNLYINSQDNQYSDEKIIKIIPKLDHGISLITVSNKALGSWFNIPSTITQRNDLDQFIGSIKVDQSNIFLNGILNFIDEVTLIKNQIEDNSLLNQLGSEMNLEDIAILNKPISILDVKSNDPIAQIIRPILDNYINSLDLKEAKKIAEVENGEMVFARSGKDWIIGTNKNNQKEIINEALLKQKFSSEKVSTQEGDVEVWSRIKLNEVNGNQEINKEIAFMLDQNSESNWWSNQLLLLQKRKQGSSLYLEPRNLISNNGNTLDGVSEQLSLGKSSSQQIGNWKPWMLMERIIGRSLEKNIQSIDIAIGSNQSEENSEINISAKLSLA